MRDKNSPTAETFPVPAGKSPLHLAGSTNSPHTPDSFIPPVDPADATPSACRHSDDSTPAQVPSTVDAAVVAAPGNTAPQTRQSASSAMPLGASRYSVVAWNTPPLPLPAGGSAASDSDTSYATPAASVHPPTDCGLGAVSLTLYPVMLKAAEVSGDLVADSNLSAGMPYGADAVRLPATAEPVPGS